MEFFWHIYESEWGNFLIVSSHKGLIKVTLPGESIAIVLNKLSQSRETIMTFKNTSLIQRTKRQLEEYFSGKRENFYLELDARGTEFQKKVWKALEKIPYGKTCSYQDIAQNISQPKAMRAIGMANNKNPIPLIVPCHRVIGKNGDLVGFGGGLELKKKLLDLESSVLRKKSLSDGPTHRSIVNATA
jgi:methylated-DNA-[protein]-cysteine S-methyltransferase